MSEQPSLVGLLPDGRKRAEVTKDDRYRAMAIVEGLAVQTDSLSVVVIEGDPPSKARPRFTVGKGGKPVSYTPKRTIEGEKRIQAGVEHLAGCFTGNVAVAALFYRRTFQRVDIDNLLKAVLDGCTRAQIWADDSQVTAITGLLEHDAVLPRSIIAFARHVSTMGRGEDALPTCEGCGKKFNPAGKRRDTARWCSPQCRMTLAEPVACEICGTMFKRRSGNQKLCGAACQAEANRRRSATMGPGPQPCEVCGKRTSKAGYKRCRACFEAGRAAA